MPKTGKILKYLTCAAVALLCVWLVAVRVEWRSFAGNLMRTDWAFMFFFAAASVVALVLRTLRWRLLLRAVDPEVGTLRVWDAINVGNLVNVALPGAGELLRCGYASRRNSYDRTLGTIVVERAWDVLMIVVLMAVTALAGMKTYGSFIRDSFSVRPELLRCALGAAVLLALGMVVVVRYRDRKPFDRVASALRGVWQGICSIGKTEHKALFALYTVGIWAMYILMSWFAIKAVPGLSGLTFGDAVFISIVGNLASVIPVPSGVGPYHYLIMLVLGSLFAVPDETGVLFAVLCHEGHTIVIIVLGIVSWLALTLRKKTC